jgi:hypothetical protein
MGYAQLPQQESMPHSSMHCSSGAPLQEHFATQPEQPPQVSLPETSGLCTQTSSTDGGAHWL